MFQLHSAANDTVMSTVVVSKESATIKYVRLLDVPGATSTRSFKLYSMHRTRWGSRNSIDVMIASSIVPHYLLYFMVRCRLGAQKHRRLSDRHEYRTSLPTLLHGQIDTSIVPHYLLYFMVR